MSQEQWSVEIEAPSPGLRRLRILDSKARLLTRGDTLAGWRDDTAFRGFFNNLLALAPFPAFLWETPPLLSATRERPFECVLVDSPALAGFAPDRESFAAYFATADDPVISFANLGGDATLVVPCPCATPAVYTHIAAFTRGAPDEQRQAFWQRIGEEAMALLSDRPLWLSTNGLGVAWLHARFDLRPKYYSYAPYRAVT